MRKIIGLFIIFTIAGMPLFSQGLQVPEAYINTGLNNNLVLLEKKVNLEKSLLLLKVAKSMFLPTTSGWKGNILWQKAGAQLKFRLVTW